MKHGIFQLPDTKNLMQINYAEGSEYVKSMLCPLY